MRQRRRVTDNSGNGDTEISSAENLYEMETQRIDLDDDNEACSSPQSARTPILTVPPELEGRRVTRASLLEATTPKESKRGRTRPPKSSLRTTRNSSTNKSTDEKDGDIATSPKSKSFEEFPVKTKPTEARFQKKQKDNEKKEVEEETVPLADFMASLNASPTNSIKSSPKMESETEAKPTPATDSKTIETEPSSKPEGSTSDKPEVSANSEGESAPAPSNEEPGTSGEAAENGKLRSAIDDAKGQALAQSYRRTLRKTEEYALNYISEEFHHPVISCFRELTKADISLIVGNSKLKKSCNQLEQSIVYLGLIDLLATVNNNPVYGESESSKITKNVSNVVQKILLEFKNIIGTWALSGNEKLTSRYTQVLNYLRNLVPMFKKAGFDQGLSSILDCIEKEVTRHKQNQEKIKTMSSSNNSIFRGTENSLDKAAPTTSTEAQEGEIRSALNEIILNVDLNVKLDDSDDDEDITVLKSDDKALQIFGKPLKDPGKKKTKKLKNLDTSKGENFKSPSTQQKQNTNSNSTTTPKSQNRGLENNRGLLPQPKTLAKVFQSPSVSQSENVKKATSTKRSANEELSGQNDGTKKRKVEDGRSKVNDSEPKSSIKSFFKSASSSVEETSANTSPTSSAKIEKPTVNAFALMMSKSREIAQKKKLDKMNGVSPASLKVK